MPFSTKYNSNTEGRICLLFFRLICIDFPEKSGFADVCWVLLVEKPEEIGKLFPPITIDNAPIPDIIKGRRKRLREKPGNLTNR